MIFKYLRNNTGDIRIDAFQMVSNGIETQIPNDPKNKDYQLYLQWLADGNTTESPEA